MDAFANVRALTKAAANGELVEVKRLVRDVKVYLNGDC